MAHGHRFFFQPSITDFFVFKCVFWNWKQEIRKEEEQLLTCIMQKSNIAHNTVISLFLVCKFCGNAEFQMNHPKLSGSCAFLQNFHTRKLVEIFDILRKMLLFLIEQLQMVDFDRSKTFAWGWWHQKTLDI